MFKIFVDGGLDESARVHLCEEIGSGRGMDAVGEEYINKVVVGVDPYHGSGESRMTERVLRCLGAGLSFGGGGEELFVKAQCAAVSLLGEMALVEEVNGGLLEIAVAMVEASVKEHLHDLSQFPGTRSSSSAPTNCATNMAT